MSEDKYERIRKINNRLSKVLFIASLALPVFTTSLTYVMIGEIYLSPLAVISLIVSTLNLITILYREGKKRNGKQ